MNRHDRSARDLTKINLYKFLERYLRYYYCEIIIIINFVKFLQLQAQQHASSVEREGSVSPVDMLGDDFNAGQRAFMDSVRSRGGRLVVATHHRTANNHKELTVVRGEYLEVH